MRMITVLGSGHIGRIIADHLAERPDFHVTLADHEEARLSGLPPRVSGRVIDVGDRLELRRGLDGQEMVVSACPFYLNPAIAEAARDCRAHYFDLTEDVETTRAIAAIAGEAETAFVPQCGLAPGFIGIVGRHMAQGFEVAQAIHLRVGALPLYPTNSLKYNLTWSTAGLINEYCNPCPALIGGRPVELLPLEGLERFSLDGVDYEAFNTSGGLGTLSQTLAGRVDSLNYKTIRYPGHHDILQVLLNDLGLKDDRQTLCRIFERAIPETDQDVVVILVDAIGIKAGRLRRETYSHKIYGTPHCSAIQAATAAGLCGVVELFAEGKLPQRGFIHQQEVELTDFLATRYGRVFRRAGEE